MSVDVVTFGCRLNAFESEIIRRARGGRRPRRAVVFNTCAVTNEAVAQARQTIRKLKRERPERAHRRHRLRRADAGRRCSPRMDEVDRVLGNDDKLRARRLGKRRALRSAWPRTAAQRSPSPTSWR